MKLTNKVAIVTGASSGIGKETALLFASEGASVVVADVNDKAGQEVVNEIEKNGGIASFIHADVSDAIEVKAMVKHLRSSVNMVRCISYLTMRVSCTVMMTEQRRPARKSSI